MQNFHRVQAPEGFEAMINWRDAIREWEVSARPINAIWWTVVGSIGHCHLTDEELEKRAADAVARAYSLDMIR